MFKVSNYCECSMSLLFCQLFSDHRRHTLTQEQYKKQGGRILIFTLITLMCLIAIHIRLFFFSKFCTVYMFDRHYTFIKSLIKSLLKSTFINIYSYYVRLFGKLLIYTFMISLECPRVYVY